MRRHSKSVEATSRNPDAMWNMDPQAIETASRTYRAWFDQASRVQDETLRFAQERFTKELDAAVRLAACADATEMFAVQAAFANSMAADYFAESRKMVELIGEMAMGIFPNPEPYRAHR